MKRETASSYSVAAEVPEIIDDMPVRIEDAYAALVDSCAVLVEACCKPFLADPLGVLLAVRAYDLGMDSGCLCDL